MRRCPQVRLDKPPTLRIFLYRTVREGFSKPRLRFRGVAFEGMVR